MESEQDLRPLIDELGDEVMVHYHDRLENHNDFASLSGTNVACGGIGGDPDETISAFCDLIEGLSQNSKDIWSKCCQKEFDIGFESGNIGKQLELRLENETLKRVVELGATIEITVYPLPKVILGPEV